MKSIIGIVASCAYCGAEYKMSAADNEAAAKDSVHSHYTQPRAVDYILRRHGWETSGFHGNYYAPLKEGLARPFWTDKTWPPRACLDCAAAGHNHGYYRSMTEKLTRIALRRLHAVSPTFGCLIYVKRLRSASEYAQMIIGKDYTQFYYEPAYVGRGKIAMYSGAYGDEVKKAMEYVGLRTSQVATVPDGKTLTIAYV